MEKVISGTTGTIGTTNYPQGTYSNLRVPTGSLSSNGSIYTQNRQFFLFQCKNKQKNFRISTSKSLWLFYNHFDPSYNLREILDSEIVIEFDDDKFEGTLEEFQNQISWPGINFTAINLYNAGFKFEIWDHGGKSPHLHIRNLPIDHLLKDELRTFKKVFIRKFVPLEYLPYVDTSLCGIHLVALEWSNHWKGKYSIKKLLNKFDPSGEIKNEL